MMLREPWIKRKKVKTVVEDGIEYIVYYTKVEIVVMRFAKIIQLNLWRCGIAVHDPIFGECTPDFNCCCKIGRKAYLRFGNRPT